MIKEFGVDKIGTFISKNFLWIVILLFVLYIVLMYFTNNYNFAFKIIKIVEPDGKINNFRFLEIQNKYLLLSLFNNLILNIAVALFISGFFLRYIEKKEKEEFYKKLENFQKETAKNAIKSIYERLIEPEFFAILEKDVLSENLIRHNAKWDYDFIINHNNKIELKRTVMYTLKNISNNVETETFKVIFENNIHSSIELSECKYKKKNENEYRDIIMEQSNIDHKFEAQKAIIIEPGEEVQVILSIKEVFKCDYVYETHSTRFPIVNLSLNVNFPKNWIFEIVVDNFSNPLEKIYVSENKIKYQTQGGIYKGQGIEFILYKEENETT